MLERLPRPSIKPSRREHAAGVTLFLAVSAGWNLGLAAAEQDWIGFEDLLVLVAAGLSAASVVVTGYLGRFRDALVLGWIPGATMVAIGFSMSPEPGGDETGGAMIFIGGPLLIPGWPLYFFPLIGLGVVLRGWRAGPPAPTPGSPPGVGLPSRTLGG